MDKGKKPTLPLSSHQPDEKEKEAKPKLGFFQKLTPRSKTLSPGTASSPRAPSPTRAPSPGRAPPSPKAAISPKTGVHSRLTPFSKTSPRPRSHEEADKVAAEVAPEAHSTEPAPEATPAPETESTPEPTTEPTPEPTPVSVEATPEATSEPTPEPTPAAEATPEPSPEPTSEPQAVEDEPKKSRRAHRNRDESEESESESESEEDRKARKKKGRGKKGKGKRRGKKDDDDEGSDSSEGGMSDGSEDEFSFGSYSSKENKTDLYQIRYDFRYGSVPEGVTVLNEKHEIIDPVFEQDQTSLNWCMVVPAGGYLKCETNLRSEWGWSRPPKHTVQLDVNMDLTGEVSNCGKITNLRKPQVNPQTLTNRG
eukprot:c10048_g2_i2.p1 GENE.c10048_g2_i2~~c10048_g2_i2.p1  ORF type:complete len:367 (+),score=93.58 c10048_g2_i2:61-1161(+)